jgi:hypothetical protein
MTCAKCPLTVINMSNYPNLKIAIFVTKNEVRISGLFIYLCDIKMNPAPKSSLYIVVHISVSPVYDPTYRRRT